MAREITSRDQRAIEFWNMAIDIGSSHQGEAFVRDLISQGWKFVNYEPTRGGQMRASLLCNDLTQGRAMVVFTVHNEVGSQVLGKFGLPQLKHCIDNNIFVTIAGVPEMGIPNRYLLPYASIDNSGSLDSSKSAILCLSEETFLRVREVIHQFDCEI